MSKYRGNPKDTRDPFNRPIDNRESILLTLLQKDRQRHVEKRRREVTVVVHRLPTTHSFHRTY